MSMSMRRRVGGAGAGGIDGRSSVEDGGDRRDPERGSLLSRAVSSAFSFVRVAEFEILFILFLIAAFIIFKHLTSRPEYNQIFVKKPFGDDFWPY